jgi:hypothetical protein
MNCLIVELTNAPQQFNTSSIQHRFNIISTPNRVYKNYTQPGQRQLLKKRTATVQKKVKSALPQCKTSKFGVN